MFSAEVIVEAISDDHQLIEGRILSGTVRCGDVILRIEENFSKRDTIDTEQYVNLQRVRIQILEIRFFGRALKELDSPHNAIFKIENCQKIKLQKSTVLVLGKG